MKTEKKRNVGSHLQLDLIQFFYVTLLWLFKIKKYKCVFKLRDGIGLEDIQNVLK